MGRRKKLKEAHEQDPNKGPKPRVPAHARPPERNTTEMKPQADHRIPLNRSKTQTEPNRTKAKKRNNTTNTLKKTGGIHQKHAPEESATTTTPDTTHRNKDNWQPLPKNNKKAEQLSNANDDADKCFCGRGPERVDTPPAPPVPTANKDGNPRHHAYSDTVEAS